ncbi:hypothetical protein HDU92_004558 [Lobulomyces angularis]|nr:hypothetical protein HDU92_004558 [Lobulomyces angularis]
MQPLAESTSQHYINCSTKHSKEKAIQFFGENAVPLYFGKGNSGKVNKVLNSITVTIPDPFLLNVADFKRRSLDSLTSLGSIEAALKSPSLLDLEVFNQTPTIPQIQFSSIPLYNRSTRKIENLMGVQCPVDISAQEIVRSGLSSLLQSKIPLCYFLAFLLCQRTPEILFFYFDVVNFEQKIYENFSEQEADSHKIYVAYLNLNSLLELNVSQKSKVSALANLKKKSLLGCFQSTSTENQKMLEDNFQLFKESNFFSLMKEKIGHNQIHDKKVKEYTKGVVEDALFKSYMKNNISEANALCEADSLGSGAELLKSAPFTPSDITGIDFDQKQRDNYRNIVKSNKTLAGIIDSEVDFAKNLNDQINLVYFKTSQFLEKIIY